MARFGDVRLHEMHKLSHPVVFNYAREGSARWGASGRVGQRVIHLALRSRAPCRASFKATGEESFAYVSSPTIDCE